jgi:membrane protein implicated in regulation of membrane protease activity
MIEYFAENLWQAWAIVAVLGLILELSSGDFFIICFSIGAVAAAAVSAFTGIYVQLAVFIVVTALSIFLVRPFALRYLHRNEDNRTSNGDALIGLTGHVSQTIEAGAYGRVNVGGDDWKAQAANPQITIEKGHRVEVVDRQSIIITVKEV